MEKITKELLKLRGIESKEDVLEFFSSKPKKTFSYKNLPDIESGLDLILDEINSNHKIMIYGDYDCDGITATALMYEALSYLMKKENLAYYIPDRMLEGYSLNMEAIKKIKDMGYDLIITVDCGSTSKEEVEFAKSLGLKILVTDHHNIKDVIPNTLVINPKRPDSKYEFSELSGCGVAFKVVQGLVDRKVIPHDILTRVLDLVAIGTVGDIMPLISENRTFVKFGLKVIELGSRIGLVKLMECAMLDRKGIDSYRVGFQIVPHLNASGRLYDASVAVKLLLTKEKDEAEKIASKLVLLNLERKHLQEDAFLKGIEKLEGMNGPFIFLRLDESHEGILGIVAGKIKDKYYKPTVILKKIDDMYLKGTGRSIPGIDMYSLFNKYQDLFLKFGGHTSACGFTISEDNFAILKSKILEEMNCIDKDLLKKKDKYDLEISISDLTIDLAKELTLFEPFGKENETPKFRVRCEIDDVIYMGQGSKHLKFVSNNIEFVLFNHGDMYERCDLVGKKRDVIGEFNLKYYKGIEKLQFIIDEIK